MLDRITVNTKELTDRQKTVNQFHFNKKGNSITDRSGSIDNVDLAVK